MIVRTGYSDRHVRDMGPSAPGRLPGWHAHEAHPLGSQLLGESSGGAGQPTKPNRVGDAEILPAQRLASEERRRDRR